MGIDSNTPHPGLSLDDTLLGLQTRGRSQSHSQVKMLLTLQLGLFIFTLI